MNSAAQLKQLKTANPDIYRERLREIEARALGTPATSSASPDAGASHSMTSPRRRSVELLIEHFRQAGLVDDTQARGLKDIRRNTIYSCAMMRGRMLSSLPLRLYRMDDRPDGGRKIDHRNPMTRLGWPTRVRGQRVAEAGAVTEVTDHPLAVLLDRPNEDWSGRQLVQQTEVGLGLVGEAHWRLHKPMIDSISWIKHSRLKVVKPGPSDKARTVAGWDLDKNTSNYERLEPGEIIWLRYVDPEDPDYGSLAPAEVAALGAQAYYDALKSNRDIFARGMRASGAFVPPEEMAALDYEQADEIAADVERMLVGSRNNHRAAVFPYKLNFERFDVSPRDAEFIALMDFAIEDTARAFGLPIELVGGSRRTYSNLENALQAVWMHTMEPEACYVAEELTAKLLPAVGLEGHFLAFDLSEVVSLQDDEVAKWSRAKEQITSGAVTVNEWREQEGLDPLPWGGAWWAPSGLLPVVDQDISLPDEEPESAPEAVEEEPEPLSAGWIANALRESDEDAPAEIGPGRVVEYGSEEHRAILRQVEEAEEPIIETFSESVEQLMRRQMTSLMDALRDDSRAHMRLSIGDIAKLFNAARWIREFRERALRDLRAAVRAGKDIAEGGIEEASPFDPGDPASIRELRRQTQSFAERVNDTTWRLLRGSLVQGLRDGENPRELARRVESVMGSRIRSSKETIARTEVHKAVQRGSLETVMAMDGDFVKKWVSALDERTRKTHRSAHDSDPIPATEDFRVGKAKGPMPGNMDEPEESINCRCTVTFRRVRRAVESTEQERSDAAVHAIAARG